VSHAILQKRPNEASSVARVPAHEVEAAALKAARDHLEESDANVDASSWSDRELVDRCIDRITIKDRLIEIQFLNTSKHKIDKSPITGRSAKPVRKRKPLPVITMPWTATPFAANKGVVHSPHKPAMTAEHRAALLTAIAKARAWVEDLVEGRITSFAEIAKREGKVERHIRLLAQLALVSPRIVQAINDAAISIKVTQLAKAAVPAWERQQVRVGISGPAD
jgi:hypothetical protein